MKRTFRQGSMIGDKYEILSYEGEGPLEEDIYRCKQINIGREVRLKLMPMLADKEMNARFQQEVKLSFSLQHPAILVALDSGEHMGRPFLVTSIVKGETLASRLSREKKLDEARVLQMGKILAEALRYAYANCRILHRNIRPESVLFGPDESVLLEDFGMAKTTGNNDSGLTMAGYTIGHPEYMSPEQVIAQQDLDCRSDIYCLGLVLYQSLCGKHPFEKMINNPICLMEAQLKEIPIPIKTICPDVTEETSTLLEILLSKDRKDRPDSWDSVIDLFKQAEDACENKQINQPKETANVLSSKSLPPRDVKPSKTKSSLNLFAPWIIIPIILILGIALAFGLYYLSRN